MDILYEDNHLIIINKQAGELVQGDKTGDESLDKTIKKYLKKKYNKPGNVFLGVTHRLDRPVSGIVIFARTSKALSRINKLFKKGDINKIYWAVVKTKPPKTQDTLTNYLVKNEKMNKSFVVNHKNTKAKEASLTYQLLSSSDNYHLLEITLHTGRHHQVRCQLANIGCPIKGDLKYGFPRSNPNAGISLHARSVSFVHPVKKEPITITAPVLQGDKLFQEFEKTVLK